MNITNEIKESIGITAINTFLSCWDSKKSYKQIINEMKGKYSWDGVGMDIAIWEPFENESPDNVRDYIVCLYENIIDTFKDA